MLLLEMLGTAETVTIDKDNTTDCKRMLVTGKRHQSKSKSN